MSYKAIALVHNNIAKRGGKVGYVVLAGGFSENARLYAEELNVQLIDRLRLAEMYMESIEGHPLPQYVLNPASNELAGSFSCTSYQSLTLQSNVVTNPNACLLEDKTYQLHNYSFDFGLYLISVL